jgi:hypothetical protein
LLRFDARSGRNTAHFGLLRVYRSLRFALSGGAAEHTSLRSILRLELTPFCPILRRSRVDKWAALDAVCFLFFALIAEKWESLYLVYSLFFGFSLRYWVFSWSSIFIGWQNMFLSGYL